MKESTFRYRLRRSLLRYALCLASIGALAGTGRVEAAQADAPTAQQLIDQVRKGSFTPAMLNRLVQLRAVEAIPVLEQQFGVVTDVVSRQALASALVRLGDGDPRYWDFLVERATPAVESDAPFPLAFDAAGRPLPRQLTPDFIAWASSHKLSAEAASHEQAYGLPVDLTFLAMTGDPRALPLLRRALASRNYLLQAVAAKGLARLQDVSSVPAIIDAARNAPAQVAELIARTLVFFDDPRAQAAADMFITNREVLDELRKISRERGPAGVF
jgi:HEAT repeat protein